MLRWRNMAVSSVLAHDMFWCVMLFALHMSCMHSNVTDQKPFIKITIKPCAFVQLEQDLLDYFAANLL